MSGGILQWGVALPRRSFGLGGPAGAGSATRDSKGNQFRVRVLGQDEDSFTLGVAAALDALGTESSVDRLFFVTSQAPFKDSGMAATLADYLNLSGKTGCYDLQGGIGAGSRALNLAFETLKPNEKVLVVVSDSPHGEPNFKSGEFNGAAAVALLLTGEGARVELLARNHQTSSFRAQWHTEVGFGRADQRYSLEESYLPLMGEVFKDLMKELNCDLGEIKSLVAAAPDLRVGGRLAHGLGFLEKQYGDQVSSQVGLTGAAHHFLLLISALEEGNLDDRLLSLDYGDGGYGYLWKINAPLVEQPERKVSRELRSGVEISFEHYSQMREAIPQTQGFTSEIMEERNKKLWRGLIAQQCTLCERRVTLPLKHCPACGGTELKEFPLRRRGKVFSFTREHYFPSAEGATFMAVIHLEGGGALTLQVADAFSEEITIGSEVELTLRRLHVLNSRPGYFWKCRKVVSPEEIPTETSTETGINSQQGASL